MSTSAQTRQTGYFDAMANGAFKRGTNGSTLFYPWGAMGRGYVVPTQHDENLLRSQLKAFSQVSLPLVFSAIVVQLLQPVINQTVAISLLFCLGGMILGASFLYAAWTRSLRQLLESTTERLAFVESMRNQAHAQRRWTLWMMLGTFLAVAVIGAVMLAFVPAMRHVALGLTIGGSISTALIVNMMIMRRQVAN